MIADEADDRLYAGLQAIADLTPGLLAVALRERQSVSIGDADAGEATDSDYVTILQQIFDVEVPAPMVVRHVALVSVGVIELLCRRLDIDPAELLEAFALCQLEH